MLKNRYFIWCVNSVLFIFCCVILTSCIGGGYLPIRDSKRYMTLTFESPELIQNVLNQKKISDDDFARLSKSWSYNVRSMIALNPYLPKNILTELANDDHELVRRGVAINRSIDRKIIDKLLKDPDEYVVKCLARNPRVPENILLEIYQRFKGDEYLDTFFLENPKCPPQIRKELEAMRDRWIKKNLEYRRKHNMPLPK